MATNVDMTYSCTDGIWTRFYPETAQGDEAYNVMARADKDGAVAFLAHQVPGVLSQLRKAGYTVRKAPKRKPIREGELDAILRELDML